MILNASGVVKATVTASFPSGGVTCGGKAQTTDHRLLINANAPDAGTVIRGVGTKTGMMAAVLGPAPATAPRFRGRAYNGAGQQYYVTSGTKAFSRDRLSFTSNGDLLVDTT